MGVRLWTPVIGNRHADTLICLQWCVLVLTLRLAVCMFLGKYRIKFGQNFFASPKICTPVHLCLYCTCVLYNNVLLFGKKIVSYIHFWRKRCVAHNVLQLLFRTRFFVLTKFSVSNGSHMDDHRIYALTVVHLFKCICNLGPRAVDTGMLQTPFYFNPALIKRTNLLFKAAVLTPFGWCRCRSAE